MPVIECGEALFTEPLDTRQHGRVDEAEAVVGIPLEQRRDPQQVGCRGVEHPVGTSGDVLQQAVERGWPGRPTVVLHLDQDRCRDQAWLARTGNEPRTRFMVGVADVQGGDQGTSVEDQRHGSGVKTSSSAVRRALTISAQSTVPTLSGAGGT